MDYHKIKRFGTRVASGLGKVIRKRARVYHPMITASDAEIREWNRLVTTRQVMRRLLRPWKARVS